MKQLALPAGLCAAALALSVAARAAPPAPDQPWRKRWVYLPGNLYVNENVTKLASVIRRAAAAGYNGVLCDDYKLGFWWTLDDARRWQTNAGRLREITKASGLELVVCVFPFGRAGPLLRHDVNLASGLPVRDAPLIARAGRLVPEQTAALRNGSFEEYRGDRAAHYAFQDDSGRGSFIDTRVVKEGQAALRFEDVGRANPHGHGRICQQVRVRPWQQYRLRAWMKTEHLTADALQLLVLANGRTLQWQHLQAPDGEGRRYAGAPRDLTTDWIEQRVAFNSLDNTNVNVYAGIWGGKTGKIWWDDLRIDAVPTLNLLRRASPPAPDSAATPHRLQGESLPVAVKAEHGALFVEGRDYQPIADPGLGARPWAGEYDTAHDPPAIGLPAGSRIREGQRVWFSGYHTALVYDGQVNCSLADARVFELCAEEVRRARVALTPDGYFMAHDEIRCGGWEPGETGRFPTSGAMLADNARRCYELAAREGGGKPVYVWSDMFDPWHNARADYYLVNNTLTNSWEGLDRSVIVMKWGGGDMARPGLQFFAKRGHRQMIAAYYDGNVADDQRMWTEAARGVPGVIGVMYTTWQGDYANLEQFAQVWWGGGAGAGGTQ